MRGYPAIAYDFSQPQLAPQAQASPQRQPARRSDWAAWQPQLQVLPAQVPQVQAFLSVFMVSSSSVALTSLSTRRTIAFHPFLEIGRSSWFPWTNWLSCADEAISRADRTQPLRRPRWADDRQPCCERPP